MLILVKVVLLETSQIIQHFVAMLILPHFFRITSIQLFLFHFKLDTVFIILKCSLRH